MLAEATRGLTLASVIPKRIQQNESFISYNILGWLFGIKVLGGYQAY